MMALSIMLVVSHELGIDFEHDVKKYCRTCTNPWKYPIIESHDIIISIMLPFYEYVMDVMDIMRFEDLIELAWVDTMIDMLIS